MHHTREQLVERSKPELLDIMSVGEHVQLDQCTDAVVLLVYAYLILEELDNFGAIVVVHVRESLIV